MPSVSPRQQHLMGADLARKRAGRRTVTGMSETKLEEFARKPASGYRAGREAASSGRHVLESAKYAEGGKVTPDQREESGTRRRADMEKRTPSLREGDIPIPEVGRGKYPIQQVWPDRDSSSYGERLAHGGRVEAPRHEQSVTVQREDGRWENQWGPATPRAGRPLPKVFPWEKESYATEREASSDAKRRSEMTDPETEAPYGSELTYAHGGEVGAIPPWTMKHLQSGYQSLGSTAARQAERPSYRAGGTVSTPTALPTSRQLRGIGGAARAPLPANRQLRSGFRTPSAYERGALR